MFTQTWPFPPPAAGVALTTGFAAITAAGLPGALGVLVAGGEADTVAGFLLNQEDLDGEGLTEVALANGEAAAATDADGAAPFLWLRCFAGEGDARGVPLGVGDCAASNGAAAKAMTARMGASFRSMKGGYKFAFSCQSFCGRSPQTIRIASFCGIKKSGPQINPTDT